MKTMETATVPQTAPIDRTDGSLWSHGFVPVDPPELATTPEFRADMIEARERRGLSQERLGNMVGTSQNMISLIESGAVRGSKYVLPIARKLGIRLPVHHGGDEDQQTWSALGQLLASKSAKQFRQAMALVEAMVEDQTEDEDEAHVAPARRPPQR